MRISAASAFLALSLCLCVPAAFGQHPPAVPAQDNPASAPAKPAPAPVPASSARSDAAEARYRNWVEKEHAQDAAVFAKEKTKIEDKYKGYVRPKREKKDAKGEQAAPPAKP